MLYARIYFPGLVQGWMLSKDQIPSLSFRKLSYNLLIKIVKNTLSQARIYPIWSSNKPRKKEILLAPDYVHLENSWTRKLKEFQF